MRVTVSSGGGGGRGRRSTVQGKDGCTRQTFVSTSTGGGEDEAYLSYVYLLLVLEVHLPPELSLVPSCIVVPLIKQGV